MNQNQLRDDTEPRSVDQQQACSLTVVWRARYGLERPERQACEKPGWPNCTTDGETMYENTHFTEEAEAWEKLIVENRAGLSLDTARVEELRKQLRKAEETAATAGIVYIACVKAHEEWQRESANVQAQTRRE